MHRPCLRLRLRLCSNRARRPTRRRAGRAASCSSSSSRPRRSGCARARSCSSASRRRSPPGLVAQLVRLGRPRQPHLADVDGHHTRRYGSKYANVGGSCANAPSAQSGSGSSPTPRTSPNLWQQHTGAAAPLAAPPRPQPCPPPLDEAAASRTVSARARPAPARRNWRFTADRGTFPSSRIAAPTGAA